MNLYAYVHNDPLNFTDPTGEAAVLVCLTPACAIAGAAVRKAGVWGIRKLASALASNAASDSTAGLDLDGMSESGRELDPADKGGELTTAGRAGQKHGSRPGSAFPPVTGSAEDKNQQGQDILDGILTDPDSTATEGNRFGEGGVDVRDSEGRGARFDEERRFRGFLEP